MESVEPFGDDLEKSGDTTKSICIYHGECIRKIKSLEEAVNKELRAEMKTLTLSDAKRRENLTGITEGLKSVRELLTITREEIAFSRGEIKEMKDQYLPLWKNIGGLREYFDERFNTFSDKFDTRIGEVHKKIEGMQPIKPAEPEEKGWKGVFKGITRNKLLSIAVFILVFTVAFLLITQWHDIAPILREYFKKPN